MGKIPKFIDVQDDMQIPIEQVKDLDALGHWSETENVVRLRENQEHAGKVVVLMHEMIHMAETQMIAMGILGRFYDWFIRPFWGETLVEHLSSFLFAWMARTNMLNPELITRDEAIEFIESQGE